MSKVQGGLRYDLVYNAHNKITNKTTSAFKADVFLNIENNSEDWENVSKYTLREIL